jgi:hypothetical protein
MNAGKKASCQQLFTELNILPVHSQYILPILIFVAKNKDQFVSNLQVHKINTRQTTDLYMPIVNFTTYQKGTYYQGIKIYNHLSKAIKDLSGNTGNKKISLTQLILQFEGIL